MYVLAHAIIFRPPQTAGLSAILHQDHCCIAYVNAPITQLRIVRAYSAGDVIRITRNVRMYHAAVILMQKSQATGCLRRFEYYCLC